MGEKKVKRKVSKESNSSLIKFTVLNINLWAIYLFMDITFLVYIPIFTTSINLILILFRYLKGRKIKSDTHVNRKDLSQLAMKFIRINRTLLLATIVGIILSTMIISQTFILSSTYERQIFDDYFGDSDTVAISFRVTDNSANFSTLFTDLEPEVISEFETQEVNYAGGTMDKLLSIGLTTTKYSQYSETSNRMDTVYNRLVVMNQEVYDFFKNFPSFDEEKTPFDPNRTYYFVDPSDNEKYTSDISEMIEQNEVEILLDDGEFDINDNIGDIDFQNITIHVDYFWQITDKDRDYFDQVVNYYNEYMNGIFHGSILMNSTRQENIIQIIQDQETKEDPSIPRHYFRYYTIINDMSEKALIELSDNLERLARNIYNIVNKYFEVRRVESPLFWQINNYIDYSALMRFSLLLASIPLLVLSLFLVYFSITLVEQRKRRLLALMRNRGTSGSQIQYMLFSEILSTSSISLLAGMALSIPYTIWIITNETILGMGIISITPDWYWKLPILGIVLGIDVNISSLLSFSKVKVEEAEQAEEKRKPFWQRAHLDLGGFGLSIFLWILLRTVPFDQFLREVLTFTIGPIALILLLVSSPLVIARYFSSLIDIISNFLLKISGGLLTLATHNLKKNRYTASKLTALLSIGFMLSLMAITIPYTLDQNTLVEARYNTGADITITGLDMNNATQMAALNIEEIEAYSEIIKISLSNPEREGMGSNIYRYDFLGVNTSSIANTLFWEERYSPQTIEEIAKSLEGNYTIGLQSHEKIGLGLDIGENLSLQMSLDLQRDFTIVNEYTYFPRIVYRLPWYNPYDDRYYIDSLSMVTSINTVKDIISSVGPSVSIDFQGILVKITDGHDLSEVAEKLRELLGETIQVHSYLDEYSNTFNLPEIVLILSLIEGMLLVTVITGIASVLYFSFITLSERKREIGVFRAFGMIRRQIFLLLVIEIIIIVSTGLVFGIGVGYFLTSNFMHLFSVGNSNSAPGFQLFVPLDTLFIFTLLTFTLTIISAAIPSFLAARKQTGSILRAE